MENTKNSHFNHRKRIKNKYKIHGIDIFEKDGQYYGHIHFQCEKCGAMIHLSDRLTADYLKSVSENFGFKVDFSLSSLNGLCEKCRTFE